jgi:ATP-dependent Clp protease ATP-binding subunit ClpC
MWKSWLKRLFNSSEAHPLGHETNSEPKARITVRSRQVLNIALQVTDERHDKIVRDEYLLIALVRENEGIAARSLRELGVTAEKLEPIIYGAVKPIPANNKPHEISDLRRLLDLATDEALLQNLDYVGTEHLLLGLMRQEDLLPVKALKQLGITPQMVQAKVKALLAEPPSSQ